MLRLQGLQEVAQVGFVEILDQGLQALGFRGLDGVGGGGQEFRVELPFLVPEGQGLGPIGFWKRRLVFDFQHEPVLGGWVAGLLGACASLRNAPERSDWRIG
jgi:hypothetical protein